MITTEMVLPGDVVRYEDVVGRVDSLKQKECSCCAALSILTIVSEGIIHPFTVLGDEPIEILSRRSEQTDRIDEAFPHIARARQKVESGERTPLHHHYSGSGQDLPHIVAIIGGKEIPAALYRGTCNRSNIDCFVGLEAGIIVPCPACALEES